MFKPPLRITQRNCSVLQSGIMNMQSANGPGADHHLCQLQESLSVTAPWHSDSDYTFT